MNKYLKNITPISPKTLLKYGDCSADVIKLRQNLNSFGYDVNTTNNCFDENLGYIVRAFNFRFRYDKKDTWGYWDSLGELIIQTLLKIRLEEVSS